MKPALILGSQSPRRRQLLSYITEPLKVSFDIVTPDIAEDFNPLDAFSEIASKLSQEKAKEVYRKIKDRNGAHLILCADTIVCIEGEVLNKAEDRAAASEMLLKLSGKRHEVFTGVTLLSSEHEFKTFFCQTLVTFKKIDAPLLNFYLDSMDWKDKAGSYGIQGPALGFVDKIEGSYSNVMGLPIELVYDHLRSCLEAKSNSSKK